MTTTETATGLLRCKCGAPTVEVERQADGQDVALIYTKNHGIMRVRYERIEGVCHRCKRTILLARGLTVGVS